jgi:2-keto-4-pentenoate hydratase
LLLLPEPGAASQRWRGMPDLPETDKSADEAALRNRCVKGLIAAALQGSPMPAPGLGDPQAGRAVRDQVLTHRLAAGERRIGYRLADGLIGILTDAMQFAAELVVPSDRLIAPHARPALAFRLARSVTPEMEPADMPAALGAVALAIDIGDSRLAGVPGEADRLADNGGAGCFVVDSWRAITRRFADRELILEARGRSIAPASAAALFVDPVEETMGLLARCRADGESLPEGTVLLLVGKAAALPVARGTSLVLAAGEIGTLTAQISG